MKKNSFGLIEQVFLETRNFLQLGNSVLRRSYFFNMMKRNGKYPFSRISVSGQLTFHLQIYLEYRISNSIKLLLCWYVETSHI